MLPSLLLMGRVPTLSTASRPAFGNQNIHKTKKHVQESSAWRGRSRCCFCRFFGSAPLARNSSRETCSFLPTAALSLESRAS